MVMMDVGGEGSGEVECGVGGLGRKRKRWDAKAYRKWVGEKYKKLFKQGNECGELITVSQGHSEVRGNGFKECFDGVVECARSAVAHSEEICGGAVKNVNGSRDKDRGSSKVAAVLETEQSTLTGDVLLSEVPCAEFREEQLEEGLEKGMCSSWAGSRLGPLHTRELVPKLSDLDKNSLQRSFTTDEGLSTSNVCEDSRGLEIEKLYNVVQSQSLAKTSPTRHDTLVAFEEQPKSSHMSLRVDDVQEAGGLLKRVSNGFQPECLRYSTGETVLETTSFQNCSQNSRHILSATGKGVSDILQKDQVVDVDCLNDESMAHRKERNYTAGGAAEMNGLQVVKLTSVPSEEDELEEGEIRETTEAIREADEEIGEAYEEVVEADEGTREVQGDIRREAEAGLVKELGAHFFELEEGEIGELVAVGNEIISKEENVCKFFSVLESADATGASKSSVSHQTEDDLMGNLSTGKVISDVSMQQDVEANASSAGLASSQLKEFQYPHSALPLDGVMCNSLSPQVGGTHDELVAKQDDYEVSLGDAISTKVVEAPGVFNEVHPCEDDDVANIFIGEETITDNEQHSGDVNLDGAQNLAELALGNAKSVVNEAVVICSAVHQNVDHEGISAGDEAVTDNEQHSADANLNGAQCLSKVASGNVESAEEVEAAVICSVAHQNADDGGRTSAGDEGVTDNEQFSADGVLVPNVDTAESGSQVSSCEGHRDELPQTPISEDQLTETFANQADTISRSQQTLNNDSEIRESEAMVDELLNGFCIPPHPIGLPSQPGDGCLSSQIDMLSIQGRSEAQLYGTREEFARMVGPSEHARQPFPMQPVATFGTLPTLYTDPLQNEAHKILQKIELNIRLHNEQMKQYNLDREKAIEAVNRKYLNLVENAVQSNVQRQLSLDMICHKIRLNSLLANVYRTRTNETLDQGLSALNPVEQPSTSRPWPQQNILIQPAQNSIPPQRPVQPQVVHHPSQLFANTPAAPIYRLPSAFQSPTVRAGNGMQTTPPHLRRASHQAFTLPQIQSYLRAGQAAHVAPAPTPATSTHPFLRPVSFVGEQAAEAAPAPATATSIHPLSRPVNFVGGMERQGTANLRPLLPCSISNAQLQQQNAGAVGSRIYSGYNHEVAQPATDGPGHRIIYNLDDD